MDETDRILTAEELAEYLAVPLRTVYAWRYRGGGPVGFRVGRHLRYRWVDVERWINGRLQTSEPVQPAPSAPRDAAGSRR